MKVLSWFLSVVAFAFPSLALAQDVKPNDGKWLYDMVLAHERLSALGANSTSVKEDIVPAAVLAGFIQGVASAETNSMMKAVVAAAAAENSKNSDEILNYILMLGPKSCLGDQTSVAQLALSIKNYLIKNPGAWGNSRFNIAQDAFADSFPCD